MPPLEQRFLDLADGFCATVSSETGFPTIVCDDTGHIVRSTAPGRVGDLHAASLEILRDEADEVVVTPAEAAADPRMEPGVSIPIVVDGRRVGTFGIAGPAEAARAVARSAAVVLGYWLEELACTAAASSLGPREPRRASVLCVDDSAATRDELRALLQREYEVVLARDGVEGLRAARQRPPDVVVSDYDMPRLNGLQLLLAMKGDPALRSIPFILSSANTQQKTSARLLDAGAHDFVLKSSGPEELKARVGAAIRAHRARQQAQAERQELARMAALFARREARTRAVIESSLDAIFLLAADGRIDSANGAAEKMFGFRRAELVGREFLETLIAPRSRKALAGGALRRAEAGSSPAPRLEHHGLRQDGEEFPIECHFRALGTGGSSGSCAFVRDLTDVTRSDYECVTHFETDFSGRSRSSPATRGT